MTNADGDLTDEDAADRCAYHRGTVTLLVNSAGAPNRLPPIPRQSGRGGCSNLKIKVMMAQGCADGRVAQAGIAPFAMQYQG